MFNNLDAEWVSYALIPDNAQRVVFDTKVKASSVILHGPLIKLEDFIPIAIQLGADIHYSNDYALISAVNLGRTKIVKCLLKAGADPCTEALRYAARGGFLNIVKCLVEAGANHNDYFNSALFIAKDNNRQNVVDYLESLSV